MFSFVGDTVVDPFAGSGTTSVAALETGRNSISVDIEPRYVELMEQRLRDKGILSSQLQVDMSPDCHVAPRGMFGSGVLTHFVSTSPTLTTYSGSPAFDTTDPK